MTEREGSELSADAARRILERRAKALAQPLAEAAAAGETRDLVVFACAAGTYAVGAADVVEVIALAEPTPVPGTPPAVVGVVNHRGRILPVVDLGRLFGAEGRRAGERSLLVTVTAGDASFGIMADGVPEMVSVEEDAIAPAAQQQDSLVLGVTGTMVAVLDVEALARDPRIAVNDEVERR